MDAKTYAARERLLQAAVHVLMSDRRDHSGPWDAADQEYADDMLVMATREYAALTADQDIPEARPVAGTYTDTGMPVPADDVVTLDDLRRDVP